jgi:hypothetical protein
MTEQSYETLHDNQGVSRRMVDNDGSVLEMAKKPEKRNNLNQTKKFSCNNCKNNDDRTLTDVIQFLKSTISSQLCFVFDEEFDEEEKMLEKRYYDDWIRDGSYNTAYQA